MEPRGSARTADEIVVVAGVPRSGTSLLMQMLEAGGIPPLCDGLRAPDPDNPRGYYEHAAAKRLASDATFLASAHGRAVKIVHVLVPELPGHLRYRVLLVERHLDEVLASQERMLARAGRTEPAPPRERLAAVFEAQLEAVRVWLDAQPNLVWQRVRHAELIAHPRESAERLADFLGGTSDGAAMAAVVAAELHRQRSSAAEEGGRTWRE